MNHHNHHSEEDPRWVREEFERRRRDGVAWDLLWQNLLENQVPAVFAIFYLTPLMLKLSTFFLALAEELRHGRDFSTFGHGEMAINGGVYLIALTCLVAGAFAPILGLRDLNWIGRIAMGFLAVQFVRWCFWRSAFPLDDLVAVFVVCLVSEIAVNAWRLHRGTDAGGDECD